MLGFVPVALLGFSTGPPAKRTGAAVDGGTNCTACHRTFAPANSDPRGFVRIDADSYIPGVQQVVHVTVSHPDQQRWGFQLTARLVSDETQQAGTFTGDDVVKVICDDGTAAPCAAGRTQFAEHSNAPRTAPGAGFTFDVKWTAPATDVGDIVFYAAGNAANGDGTNAGDRIYTTVRRISPPCSMSQKPTVTGAVHAATFQGAWNSGALMAVFGTGFAAAGRTRALTAGDIVNQKFPQNLACIAVSVNGQNAPIFYVQQDQINIQAPAVAGAGPATIVVIANPGTAKELRSDPMTVSTQQAFAPGLFTFNGKTVAATTADGKGIIADPSIIPGATPAKPGDIVTVYATGLGSTNPAFIPGDIASSIAPVSGAVRVTVGGVTLQPEDVLYAGAVPQSICGLSQLNMRLPSSVSDGDVPITISVEGALSPAGTTIPVKR